MVGDGTNRRRGPGIGPTEHGSLPQSSVAAGQIGTLAPIVAAKSRRRRRRVGVAPDRDVLRRGQGIVGAENRSKGLTSAASLPWWIQKRTCEQAVCRAEQVFTYVSMGPGFGSRRRGVTVLRIGSATTGTGRATCRWRSPPLRPAFGPNNPLTPGEAEVLEAARLERDRWRRPNLSRRRGLGYLSVGATLLNGSPTCRVKWRFCITVRC